LVDRYSERKESAEALSKRVNQRAIWAQKTALLKPKTGISKYVWQTY
jgi:hypothetical protein